MDEQFCPLRKTQVSRGTCNECNGYFRRLGVYPFNTCLEGHVFSVKETVCRGDKTYCPTCNRPIHVADQVGVGACCSYIICSKTCDWYNNPDHCNLARDPHDARTYIKNVTRVQAGYPIEDPKTGRTLWLKTDEYSVVKKEIANHEVMNTSEEEKKAMAVEISKEMVKVKFTHTGNVDSICQEIADGCTKALRSKYERAKVVVTFQMHPKPTISVTSPDPVTAWLLDQVIPYVSAV